MGWYFKKSVSQNLFLLTAVFGMLWLGMVVTDILFYYYIFSGYQGDPGWHPYLIKICVFGGYGTAGLIAFVVVSRKILIIARDRKASGQIIRDQNEKLLQKSAELSDIMQRFEDKNHALEISGRRLEETLKTLQDQEQDRRIIFDNSPLGIIRFDTSGSIIDFNDKFIDQMGSSREALLGFNTATKSAPKMQQAIKQALAGSESVFEDEYTSVTGKKTSFFRVVFNPVNPGVSPTQVIATIEDITKRRQAEIQLQESHIKLEQLVKERTAKLIQEIEDRKQIEEALRKSEEKYRSILENIEDVYFEVDLKGTFIFYNKAIYSFLGYSDSELRKISYKEYADRENQKILFEVFNAVYRTGITSPLIHCALFTKRKKKIDVSIRVSLIKDKSGEPLGFQALARDISRQKIMEYRLQHTQKMEAIGNLAGGIAHDFNNILGAIAGHAQLVKKYCKENSKILPYAEQILKASERAAGLVKQILLFSRGTKAKKEPSDPGIVAKEVLKLLRASIPSTIEISQKIDENLYTVLVDQTQIHQVLMNLCSNASQAMQPEGGLLEIILENIEITRKRSNEYLDINTGKYVRLSISDTGHGMDSDTVKQIFDPYFTTKKPGEGTGLGLATVHGIIKDHEGVIRVNSEVGKGTVFDIFLPAVDQKAVTDEKEEAIPTGKERVLFVDDEAYLSDVGKEMLEDFGYTVEACTSSKTAFEKFKEHPDQFDVLITDYTMPEMTGEQLIRRIQEIKPFIPVIMCTGVSLHSKITSDLGIKKVLVKPLDMKTLLLSVRKVLDDSCEY